jgi:hypothetical protein
VLIHALVGEHPDGFQLLVGEQVGFVEHEDGCASAFLPFCEKGFAGLGDQPGPEMGRGLQPSPNVNRRVLVLLTLLRR